MDEHIELWHLVLSTCILKEFFFFDSSCFISNSNNFSLSFGVSVEEIEALADYLLNEVVTLHSLRVLMDNKR